MPDWETIIEFTDQPGKFAEADVSPFDPNKSQDRPPGLSERVPTRATKPVDEPVQASRVHAPVQMAGRDPQTVRPGFLNMRARTEEAQKKVDLEQAMGTAPNLGTGTSFEEMGFHEPTPDKGRLQRIKEGIRANEADVAQFPWYLQTPYRIGKAGGQAVQGVVEEGKNIYRTAKEALAGDADPRNLTKTALDLFGGGSTKAMGAIDELGVELGAFSKSGKHLTFGPRLKEHTDIKTNFPEADFWIIRRGDRTQLGKPTREFSPEHIGIRSRNHNIDPNYLFYAFEAAHGQGHFGKYGSGTTKLENVTVKSIEDLSLGQIMRGRAATHGGDIGAFGGRGPGGRIEVEDVEAIGKELGVKTSVYTSQKDGTKYVRFTTRDLGGKQTAQVRIPVDEGSHPGTKGLYYNPREVVLDTTDANTGVSRALAENASGGRYNDIRNLRDALRWMFTKGDRPVAEGQRPRIPGAPIGDKPPSREPGTRHLQKSLKLRSPYRELEPWDDVVEFK